MYYKIDFSDNITLDWLTNIAFYHSKLRPKSFEFTDKLRGFKIF
jgi:hypothetical protein